MEDKLVSLGFPHLSILKSGLIIERRPAERSAEKFAKYIPFLPQIKARELAMGLRVGAELQHTTPHTRKLLFIILVMIILKNW